MGPDGVPDVDSDMVLSVSGVDSGVVLGVSGEGPGVVSSECPDVILGMVLDVVSGVVSVSDEERMEEREGGEEEKGKREEEEEGEGR